MPCQRVLENAFPSYDGKQFSDTLWHFLKGVAMIIKNGTVFREDKTFSIGNVYIENGMITDSPDKVTDKTEIDASGLMVLPGLVDIHSHGAVGCDFSDADVDGLRSILRYERAHGITSYCPTSMTLPMEKLKKIFSTAAQAGDSPDQAHVAGINMEGPFLDPVKKGAHVEEYILPPDVDFFRQLNAACGNMIKLVTLAPNREGAISFIKELHNETTISLGHTSSDYKTAQMAIAEGANHITHLYNAMMNLVHREPGLIGAAAESPDCMAELISDGIHIHPSAVRAAFSLFPGRICLISDSMRATGMEDGTYDLGGQEVSVVGKLATLADGTIAGSATNLFDCMRTAVSFHIPLEEAIAAASMNPARSIGIYDTVGSITPGKRADILLVDKELQLVRVI